MISKHLLWHHMYEIICVISLIIKLYLILLTSIQISNVTELQKLIYRMERTP
jgi:hypothetical protein